MMNNIFEWRGGRVQYADRPGERRSVMLTHGAGMDRSMFETQAEALHRAGHRVVSWDLPGHGASTLPPGTRFDADLALGCLAGLADHLGLDRPILIGHSLGGNLSQALVRRDPERAFALIVMDSAWNAGPLTGFERLTLRLAAPMLALIPASRLPRMMARASAATPAGVAAAEAVFARIPKPAFLDVWRATVALVDPEPAYRTPIPIALVRGQEDRTGNIATAMPRWAAAEGVFEHVVPGAGHIVTFDDPGAVTEMILNAIDGWEPERLRRDDGAGE